VQVLAQPNELDRAGRGVALALGVFDGVHLGHQEVIRRLATDAAGRGGLPVVVTFDRHPNSVVAPDRTPPLLQTTAQKLRALAMLDVAATWVIRFDTAFSRQTGEGFVRTLAGNFPPLRSVFVGEEFQFGHGRSGNVPLLHRLGGELGFRTHAVPAVHFEGQPVSSTRIREAVHDGGFALAGRLLGRPWALAGRVVRGDRLGRQLGFPTANLAVAGLVLPAPGVYVATTIVLACRRTAVVNIGHRPTLAQPEPALRVEAHLLDFDGDLYGQELELVFTRRLRDEVKFASLAALRDQIGRDVAAARLSG